MELCRCALMRPLMLVAPQPPAQVVAGVPPRGEHPVSILLRGQQHFEPLEAGEAVYEMRAIGKGGGERLSK